MGLFADLPRSQHSHYLGFNTIITKVPLPQHFEMLCGIQHTMYYCVVVLKETLALTQKHATERISP